MRRHNGQNADAGGPRIVGELDTEAAIDLATTYLRDEAPEAQEGDSGDLTTIRVANAVFDFGLSKAIALDLMLEHWNETKAYPPWLPEDLETKVGNAWRYRQNAVGSANPANDVGEIEEVA